MEDINVSTGASVEPINEEESLSECEPMVLAKVSDVTCQAEGGSGDPLDNIVWGNE